MSFSNRSLTTVSVSALATVWAVGTAAAQATDPPADTSKKSDELEEAVVTGIRASLASAQAIKQDAEQLVDSVTAEDIGKFPDANIAESL
jgi:hypothetical protein